MILSRDGPQFHLGSAARPHGVVRTLGIKEGHVIIGGSVEQGYRRFGFPVVHVILPKSRVHPGIRPGKEAIPKVLSKQLLGVLIHRGEQIGL